MQLQTEWGIVLSIIALVATALGAVWAVGNTTGGMKTEVRVLKESNAKLQGEVEAMQVQLAKGDTRFAILTHSVEGMKTTLDEIKTLLTDGPRPARARRRQDDDGDEEA